MKKTAVILMCAAALVALLAGCAKKTPNITFTGTIQEIHDASLLVSTADDVGFDKASVSFEPDTKIGFNFLAGQVIKLTILPQIAESYPVQVRAVAVELVSEPATPDPEHPDYTAAFIRADSLKAGAWEFIMTRAANAETMLISSVRHIPVITADSAQALADFIGEAGAYFQLDAAYGDSTSFTENAGKYDAAFFEKNTLLLLFAEETSGSIRHKISDLTITDGKLSVSVETVVPETGTDDMADWFIVLELPRDALAGVETFDAFYAGK